MVTLFLSGSLTKMANLFIKLFAGLCMYGIGLFWAFISVPAGLLWALIQTKFDLKKVLTKKRHDKLPQGKFLLITFFLVTIIRKYRMRNILNLLQRDLTANLEANFGPESSHGPQLHLFLI